jgi:hypothetical protein
VQLLLHLLIIPVCLLFAGRVAAAIAYILVGIFDMNNNYLVEGNYYTNFITPFFVNLYENLDGKIENSCPELSLKFNKCAKI